MERIIRNVSRQMVRTTYNGKKYVIKPKGTIVLDSVADENAAEYLLETYGFLQDITPKEKHPYAYKMESEIQRARPKRRLNY